MVRGWTMPTERTASQLTEGGNGEAHPGHPAASEVLLEALLEEQRAHWLSGQRTPVSEWFRRYPELAADPAPAAELAFHEFALRQELGEAPDWDAHLAQFPQYAAALALLRKADQ